jgi:hypothetical protein
MDFHVMHVTLEMPSNMEKQKIKVYITAGPEFGVDLHGKNLIIDKS